MMPVHLVDSSAIVSMVTETFNKLSQEQDLSPRNEGINALLSRYVSAITEASDQDYETVMNHESIQKVLPPFMQILARAEYEMENYFAEIFSRTEPLSCAGLKQFWYRANYLALVEQEINGMKKFPRGARAFIDDRPVAFIGSGPLPLSAIDLFSMTAKKCICIEMNPIAVNQSRAIIDNLGLADSISVIHADGSDHNYNDYSVIFVAALVEEKAAVLNRIKATAQDALVAIRSADGLKELLYKAVDIKEVESRGFDYQGKVLGNSLAVNSTCYFQTLTRI